MLKLSFTRAELEELKSKLYLSEIQEHILEYRAKEYSRFKMAQLENVSIQTIELINGNLWLDIVLIQK